MPVGRTDVAYVPALTPEEEAALAAEQAAAAPPPQTTMYQPSSPPPAEPVAAPAAAPVDQTTMYQPSAPPPAAEPAPAPGAGSATEPQGGNDAVYMAAPPSLTSWNRVDPAATSPAYQPAEPPASTLSPSSQDMAVADSLFHLGLNSAGSPAGSAPAPESATKTTRDLSAQPAPLPKPGVASGLSSLYAGEVAPVKTTADPNANTGGGESITDMLGRSFGLNPQDREQDMYNQMWSNVSTRGGDVLGRATRAGGELAGRFLMDQLNFQKDRAGELFGSGGGLLADQVRFQADMANRLVRSADDVWRAAEDVVGPAGNTLRQIQSTTNPLGQALAENVVDPLGAAKDRAVTHLNLGEVSDDAADFFNRGAARVQGLTEGTSSPGDTLLDLINVPLPSFGQPSPGRREIDLNQPDWTWLLTPGAVAREAGFRLGAEGRRIAEEEGAAQAQRARGAALASRARGDNPLAAALAAARPLAQDARLALRDLPLGADDMRDAIYLPQAPAFDQAGGSESRTPERVASGTTGTVRTSGAQQQDAGPSLLDRARDAVGGLLPGGDAPAPVAYDPLSSAYVPREPGAAPEVDPSLLQRAREAATEARNWAAGMGLPDVNLPSLPIPDISLPGGAPASRGGPSTGGSSAGASDPLQQVFTEQQSGATRSATQPEGTTVAQEAGTNWIKDASGNYVGLVDPATGEYVMLPANATNAEKQALVDGILTSTATNPAPGPATATTSQTPTGTSIGTATGTSNSGSTTSGTSSNGNSGGATSSNGSTARKSRSSDTSYDDDGEDDSAPLRLEDFIQDFDGDGTISKRDRMQGKKAFEQAKAARSKQRRGKTGFPFNERRSALGQQIAKDVADALAGKG